MTENQAPKREKNPWAAATTKTEWWEEMKEESQEG